MNIVVTERDKKLLRLVACLAIIVIFGMYLIRPAAGKDALLHLERGFAAHEGGQDAEHL